MNSSGNASSTQQWQIVCDKRHLGVFTHEAVMSLASAGRLPPACSLSRGEGWITLTQFIAEHGVQPGPMLAGPIAADSTAGGSAQTTEAPGAPPSADPAKRPTNAPASPTNTPARSPVAELARNGAPPPLPPTDAARPARAQASAAMAAKEADAATNGVIRLTPAELDEPPERDRIVVLGRRQSGKTIYLASVYAKLWRALDGLTAKALRGEVHKQLVDVSHVLKEGAWPASTLESRQMELEIDDHGASRLMVALDYAGEMFANAFLHERFDMPDVKTLVDHIDRAAAVMLLVDPSIAAGMDHHAATEDDFGLVQAVHRIRNWPGGDDVPIVLVLTKVDQHQALLDRFGGPDGFVRHHFPALVRHLKRIPIFQVSAVQVDRTVDGKWVPKKDSTPVNVDNPLRYCLRKIQEADDKEAEDRGAQERRMLEARMRREEAARERRQNRLLILAVILIILIGVSAIAAILLKK